MSAEVLVAALCSLFAALAPTDAFVTRAGHVVRAARTHGIPVETLAAVCWQESRLGTAPRYASLCGVRLAHRYVRDDAASADIAARTLAAMERRCRSWPSALAAYRTDGHCGSPAGRGYALQVHALAHRIGARMAAE